MNVLRAGATLRMPETTDFEQLSVSVANAEVRRQTDEWQNRSPQARSAAAACRRPTRRLRACTGAGSSPNRANVERGTRRAGKPAGRLARRRRAPAAAKEKPRLLEVRNDAAADLQNQAAAPRQPAESRPRRRGGGRGPGVELESEPVFTDEASEPDKPAQTPSEQAAATAPAARRRRRPRPAHRAVAGVAGARLVAVAAAAGSGWVSGGAPHGASGSCGAGGKSRRT